MRSCMGGWCVKREKCPHYGAKTPPFTPPDERLCIKGRDGVRLIEASPARVIHIDVFTGREIEREAA